MSQKPIKAPQAQIVDCGSGPMPGLIDCHVHVFLVEVNIRNLENVPMTAADSARADQMKLDDRSRLHHGARHRRADGASRPPSSPA